MDGGRHLLERRALRYVAILIYLLGSLCSRLRSVRLFCVAPSTYSRSVYVPTTVSHVEYACLCRSYSKYSLLIQSFLTRDCSVFLVKPASRVSVRKFQNVYLG